MTVPENPLWVKHFNHVKTISKTIRNDLNCFDQIWSGFPKSITTQAQPSSSFTELAFVKVHFNEWFIWKWLIKITNEMYGVSGMGLCFSFAASLGSRRRCVCFRSYFALHVMLLLNALCKKKKQVSNWCRESKNLAMPELDGQSDFNRNETKPPRRTNEEEEARKKTVQ